MSNQITCQLEGSGRVVRAHLICRSPDGSVMVKYQQTGVQRAKALTHAEILKIEEEANAERKD